MALNLGWSAQIHPTSDDKSRFFAAQIHPAAESKSRFSDQLLPTAVAKSWLFGGNASK